MISAFPPDHELIAFFESGPAVLDAEAPWPYNTLDFVTIRDGIEVQCHIVSSYGKITTRFILGGSEIAKFELRDADSFRLIMNEDQEVLIVSFLPQLRLDNFALQLKPRVWAAWGNLHQYP